MNVLMIAPGYPDEMPLFCRGLSTYGASVYGISDVPVGQPAGDDAATSLRLPADVAC